MKHFLKQIVLNVLNTFSPMKDGVSILMYHSVSDNNLSIAVKSENFTKQIDYLSKHNYKVLKLEEVFLKLKNKEKFQPKSVVLTFDDGYKDNYTEVFPILKKFNFPATIFLITGLVGKNMATRNGPSLPMLSEDQILEMKESGLVDFQPHSVTHSEFDYLPDDVVRSEMADSRSYLDSKFGDGHNFFAYPRGKYNERTSSIAKKEGFEAGFTVKEGIVRLNDDMFELKRNGIGRKTSITEFKAKITNSIEMFRKIFHENKAN